jgi:4-diphosphocytidyl-2-C-methyl-D-erythritol kinase
MITFPNAKINIGLRVLRKRADGFHDIESIFYPIPLTDVLEISTVPRPAPLLAVHGIEIDGSVEENLVFKAWRKVSERFAVPPHEIALLKNIPTGAGLGGGSADAAFALKLLSEIHQLQLEDSKLESMAAELGSDCPFFIQNRPMYVTGRGEHMEPIELDLSGWYMALLHPGVHVSTPKAYSMVVPQERETNLKRLIQLSPDQWGELGLNDFQAPMCEAFPEIQEAIHLLEGMEASFVSMTGSGSAVYGLYKTLPTLPDTPEHWFKAVLEL